MGENSVGEAIFSRANPEMFETPVQPMSVSGGTAAFFALNLRTPFLQPGMAENWYIGKVCVKKP